MVVVRVDVAVHPPPGRAAQAPHAVCEAEPDEENAGDGLHLLAGALEDRAPEREAEEAEERRDGHVAEAAEKRDTGRPAGGPALRARERRERQPVIRRERVERADRNGGSGEGEEESVLHVSSC